MRIGEGQPTTQGGVSEPSWQESDQEAVGVVAETRPDAARQMITTIKERRAEGGDCPHPGCSLRAK